jgi:hypothetical protein
VRVIVGHGISFVNRRVCLAARHGVLFVRFRYGRVTRVAHVKGLDLSALPLLEAAG